MSPGGLTWRCDGCSQPIDDGDGWLTVDVRAAIARERRADRIEHHGGGLQAIDIGALMRIGDAIPWRAVHPDCDPDHGQAGYCIPVARVRDVVELLDWYGHLGVKPWAQHTDWHSFVVRTVAPQLRAARKVA